MKQMQSLALYYKVHASSSETRSADLEIGDTAGWETRATCFGL
jgi:hypothetical protein